MQNSDITLSDIFQAETIVEEKLAELSSGEQFETFKQQLSEETQGLSLPAPAYKQLLEKILKQVNQLLNIEIKEIFRKAWKENKELKDDLQGEDSQEKKSKGISTDINLLKHSIVSKHKPHLKMKIGDQLDLGELSFDVKVEFIMTGVTLKVKDGKVSKINVDSCSAKGEVKWGVIKILELKNTLLDLPQAMDFFHEQQTKSLKAD